MDRKYIENEHILERYLAGELTVREAREFEQYCLDHPEALKSMPIPVRLKARLARRPAQDSETGVFATIPSSATHAAVEAVEDGFDIDEARVASERFGVSGASRWLVAGLALALLVALGGLIAYAMRAGTLAKQLQAVQREVHAKQLRAPSSVQMYRVSPVRQRPAESTLAPGWLTPPQLLDFHVDVSEGKYTHFQVTIDKVDGGRVLQIRRIARDSNGELRLGLNSSAFGPGEYLVKIDGYTWRGKAEEIGWLRLDLR